MNLTFEDLVAAMPLRYPSLDLAAVAETDRETTRAVEVAHPGKPKPATRWTPPWTRRFVSATVASPVANGTGMRAR